MYPLLQDWLGKRGLVQGGILGRHGKSISQGGTDKGKKDQAGVKIRRYALDYSVLTLTEEQAI